MVHYSSLIIGINLAMETSNIRTMSNFPILVKTALIFPITWPPALFPKRGVRALYCSSFVSILCFSLTSTGDIELSVEKLNKQKSLVDYGGHYTYCCLPALIEKLKKGLGKRIHQIQLRHDTPQTVRYLSQCMRFSTMWYV